MMRALLWLNADGPSDELIAQLIEGADIVRAWMEVRTEQSVLDLK